MANVESANNGKVKKERKAEHAVVNADGRTEVGEGKEARDVGFAEGVGIRYTELATGKVWDYAPALPKGLKAGHPIVMLALFGARTLAVNTASTNRTAVKAGDSDLSDIEAIEQRFADMQEGQWQSAKTREGGPRYNAATLAEAIHATKGEASEGVAAYAAKIAASVEYADGAWSRPTVKAHYLRIRAERALNAAAGDDTSAL